MIVKLRNTSLTDLTPNQSYLVIGIEADELRLLNDQGRPYLYDHQLFEMVDAHEPSDWMTEFGEDGERYAYPPALNEPGFFEDFFDTEKKAVATFWQTINQCLTRYATVDAVAV